MWKTKHEMLENYTKQSTAAGPAPPNVIHVAHLHPERCRCRSRRATGTGHKRITRYMCYRVNCDQLESDQVGGLAIRTRIHAPRTKDLNVNSEVGEILEESTDSSLRYLSEAIQQAPAQSRQRQT